jgi:hypothetical protein
MATAEIATLVTDATPSTRDSCSSQSCWTSQVAPVIAQVPVVAGEIGENDCAGSYINPLTTWLDSQNTSYLAWAWNADFNCSSGPGPVTGILHEYRHAA